MKSERINVVVLTYNRKDMLLQCIEKIYSQEYPIQDIVVIDNHSTDGTHIALKENYPDVIVVRNDQNYGASIGKNIGLKKVQQLDSDFIYFVDDDILIDNACISEMVEVVKENPEIGLVGSKIMNLDEPNEFLGAGVIMNYTQNLGWGRGKGEVDRGQYDQTEELTFLLGGSLLFKHELLNKVGFFDENFLGYWYEAQDYCLRVIKSGYKVYFAHKAKVWHKPHAEDYSYRKKYLSGRNAVYFMKKHGNPKQWFKFLFFAFAGIPYAIIRETPRGRLGGVIGKLLGMIDGFFGYEARARRMLKKRLQN